MATTDVGVNDDTFDYFVPCSTDTAQIAFQCHVEFETVILK